MRLFVALRPPPAVRDLLIDAMDGVEGARWQEDEQLHLTLRFVGEADARAADDLCAALGSLAAPASEARVAGAGSFDRRGRPDQLWAGLAPREPLAALARKVDRACAAAGFPPETRAYVPHVTLARLSRSADAGEARAWVARHGGLTSEPFRMERLILYRSHVGHAGTAYEVLDAWPLREA